MTFMIMMTIMMMKTMMMMMIMNITKQTTYRQAVQLDGLSVCQLLGLSVR